MREMPAAARIYLRAAVQGIVKYLPKYLKKFLADLKHGTLTDAGPAWYFTREKQRTAGIIERNKPA